MPKLGHTYLNVFLNSVLCFQFSGVKKHDQAFCVNGFWVEQLEFWQVRTKRQVPWSFNEPVEAPKDKLSQHPWQNDFHWWAPVMVGLWPVLDAPPYWWLVSFDTGCFMLAAHFLQEQWDPFCPATISMWLSGCNWTNKYWPEICDTVIAMEVWHTTWCMFLQISELKNNSDDDVTIVCLTFIMQGNYHITLSQLIVKPTEWGTEAWNALHQGMEWM